MSWPARWNPLAPERPIEPSPIYEDGTYLISGSGEAHTWAVCDRGRWGVVYECDGRQVLSAWVDRDVIPLHVLAAALQVADRGTAGDG